MVHKGIPFKTEWVDWPDIESVCKKIGAKPSGTKASGTPFYTLPVIHDPSTGAVISDSLKIALYLENTYPNTPSLFPGNSRAFQASFAFATYTNVIGALFHAVAIPTAKSFTPVGSEYFLKTRVDNFGEAFKVSENPPPEQVAQVWKQLEGGLSLVSSWWDAGESNGPFITGESLTFGDTVIAGLLIWARVTFGEDSQEWKKIAGWNGGRWGRLLKALEKYEILD